MKSKEYKITCIHINSLINDSFDAVSDLGLACALVDSVKTTFGDTFYMKFEQLN